MTTPPRNREKSKQAKIPMEKQLIILEDNDD